MTRKQASLMILVLVCALLLTGCAEPYTTTARVTARHYRAAHTRVQAFPVIFWHVPDQWTLSVTWLDNGSQNKWTFLVDQATYDHTAVGDQVQVVVHPGWAVDLAGH